MMRLFELITQRDTAIKSAGVLSMVAKNPLRTLETAAAGSDLLRGAQKTTDIANQAGRAARARLPQISGPTM